MAGEHRILIAEDDFALANVVRFNLEQAGHEVTWARNGQEAWQSLQAATFDLVISDHEMPLLTGVELCRQIRTATGIAAVPVILLTAKSFEIDEQTLAELKLAALLPKPFSPRELVALVDRCLENSVAHAS
jgi:DNA-binding response OmpR family regulator